MVRLAKLARLGGFADDGGKASGFASKFLPLDTPHDDGKPRWKVNLLGQKILDPGMTADEFRNQYSRALEQQCTVDERQTYLRALGLLAEKGDKVAAEIVLKSLETDESAHVRLTALTNLAYAANNRTLPCNKMILERVGNLLVDLEKDIRAKVISIYDRSIAANDSAEIDTIYNKAKQTIIESRSLSWKRLGEYALALNGCKVLLLCLCNLMSYSVLPVRMCVWEVLSRKRKLHIKTLEEAKYLEKRIYQTTNALKPKQEESHRAQTQAEELKNKILDNARDFVAFKIAELQDRGFVFEAGDHTLLDKLHQQILSANRGYIELRSIAQHKAEDLKEAINNFETERAAYEKASQSLYTEILGFISELLDEECESVKTIHKILGHQDSSAWFVRRVILQEFIIPLAQDGVSEAIVILSSRVNDRNKYIRRIVERALYDIRIKSSKLKPIDRLQRSPNSPELQQDVPTPANEERAMADQRSDSDISEDQVLEEAAKKMAYDLKTISLQRKTKHSDDSKAVLDYDGMDVNSNSNGIGSTLVRNAAGQILFRRVQPPNGAIDEGDLLMKVADNEVTQKTLSEIKLFFENSGDMCPCVVQRSNHGGRERLVFVSCNPPPYHDECLEAIGLDVEIYKSNAIRTLQIFSFLQRKGFGQYVQRVIGELHVRHLRVLASKFNKPEWIASIGMSTEEENKFQIELDVLAARFRPDDSESPRHNSRQKLPPSAHEAWKFLKGKANLKAETYKAKCRTTDVSSSLQSFRTNGRLPTLFEKHFEGIDYTLFWHEDQGIILEFSDCGTGTFRVMLTSTQNSELSKTCMGDSSNLTGQCFVCFTDGRLEPVRSLRATELLLRIQEHQYNQATQLYDDNLPELSTTAITPAPTSVLISGQSFGLKKMLSVLFHGTSDFQHLEPIFEGGEQLIGYHVDPEVGMRVILCSETRKKFKELVEETEGTSGTITWVDEEDADGDGCTGDFCEVKWDNGYVADYRTGYEGQYRLALDPTSSAKQREEQQREQYKTITGEIVIGLDIPAEAGQRVVFRETALAEFPLLAEDSQGGVGSITWVDPEDLDGDGKTGDICEVLWDNGTKGEYRTGFEGCYRLALYRPPAAGDIEKSIEDPWEGVEEAESALKLSNASFLSRSSVDSFPSGELCKLTSEGSGSRMIFGNWTAQTVSHHHGFGSTIDIQFHNRRPVPPDTVLSDMKRLRSTIGARDTAGLLSSTGLESNSKGSSNAQGEVRIYLTGDGFLFSCTCAGEACNVRFDRKGATKLDKNEAAVYAEGVPVDLIEIAARKRMAAQEAGQPANVDRGERRAAFLRRRRKNDISYLA